jgi:magnesium-transporting ATPase (P-type)
MLTGDKGETAMEIGYSCGLFKRENFDVYIIDEDEKNLGEKLEAIQDKDESRDFGIMIAGN